MQKQIIILLALLPALFTWANASAEDAIYTGFFSSAAVSGYDPVAYFSMARPVKGSNKHKLTHQGADWYFSSDENLQKFKANPEKFAPQYGGYCSWAVGHGITAKGDPQQWTIHNDKLYLNIDKNIKAQWLQDKQHWITEADRNWPRILEQ